MESEHIKDDYPFSCANNTYRQGLVQATSLSVTKGATAVYNLYERNRYIFNTSYNHLVKCKSAASKTYLILQNCISELVDFTSKAYS